LFCQNELLAQNSAPPKPWAVDSPPPSKIRNNESPAKSDKGSSAVLEPERYEKLCSFFRPPMDPQTTYLLWFFGHFVIAAWEDY